MHCSTGLQKNYQIREVKFKNGNRMYTVYSSMAGFEAEDFMDGGSARFEFETPNKDLAVAHVEEKLVVSDEVIETYTVIDSETQLSEDD